MTSYFITGTDTDVGKTLASVYYLKKTQGYYWKPIQTGVEEDESDTHRVQRETSLPEAHFVPSTYVLKAPLSPYAAASLENITIDPERFVLPPQKPLIVEGAGGVLVPITQNFTMIDLIKKLGLPTIVVARSTLGTLNHTFLTIEALRARGCPIEGVVLVGPSNPSNKKIIEEKIKVINEISF